MSTPKKPVAVIVARRLTYAIAFAYAVCAIFQVPILDIGWLGMAKAFASLVHRIPIPLVVIIVSILAETILIRRWLKTVSGGSGRNRVRFQLTELDNKNPRLFVYINWPFGADIRLSKGSPVTMKVIEWVRGQLRTNPGWIECNGDTVLFDRSALNLKSHEVEYWMELNELIDEAVVESHRKTDASGNTSTDRMRNLLDTKDRERKEKEERKNKKKAEGKEV